MQREYLKERLARSDDDLRSGLDNIEDYLDLLSSPGQLYDRAGELILIRGNRTRYNEEFPWDFRGVFVFLARFRVELECPIHRNR